MKKNVMPTFTSVINPTKRLGSGSACERCRSRKTKCDGGQPCAFCSSHKVPCIHRPTNTSDNRKKKHRKHRTYHTKSDDNTAIPSTTHTLRSNANKQHQQQNIHGMSVSHHLPEYWKRRNFKIPSIMDQLSCHTFTIEAAYSSCSSKSWH